MHTLIWEKSPFQNKFCRTWIRIMKNKKYYFALKKINKKKFYKSILIFFIFNNLFFFTDNIFAKESFPLEPSEMDKRSLKSRTASKEPEFSVSKTSSQWFGFYFGVGFRKLRFNVSDSVIISDSDAEANGIGVNLGYLWEGQGIEFERQTSIIGNKKPFSYENHKGQFLEVIQNNFWYIRYPKINRFLYFHYGAGVQFSKIRFVRTETSEFHKDEIAFGIEAGSSYFITSNMLILYRFSLGQHVPFLSNPDSDNFLNQSQIHTIFLNYYFPL